MLSSRPLSLAFCALYLSLAAFSSAQFWKKHSDAPVVGSVRPGSLYEVKNTGLEFKVPAGWKSTITKNETKFDFTLPKSGAAAEIHFFAIDFRAPADRWFDAQKDLATQMDQEILDQHQEVILGVPLLLSKARKKQSAILTGLVSAESHAKVLFRISAPTAAFDEADEAWRTAFQSLRTVSGEDPKPDDPNHLLIAKKAEFAVKPPVVTAIGVSTKVEVYKGSVVLRAKAALRDVVVRLPKGWSYKNAGDDFSLEAPDHKAGVSLHVASSLDSDSALGALLRISAKSLDQFASVSARNEADGVKTKSGCQMNYVWRDGKTSSGLLTTLESTVANGDFYAVITAKFIGGLKVADRKEISDLLMLIGIEGS